MRNWWLAASSWQCASSGIMSCAEILDKKSPRLHSPPALVPCNLWLFPKLKTPLKGKRFQTVDKIQKSMTGQLMVSGRTVCEVPRCLLSKWLSHHCPMDNVSCILYLQQMSLFFIVHNWILSGQISYILKIFLQYWKLQKDIPPTCLRLWRISATKRVRGKIWKENTNGLSPIPFQRKQRYGTLLRSPVLAGRAGSSTGHPDSTQSILPAGDQQHAKWLSKGLWMVYPRHKGQ